MACDATTLTFTGKVDHVSYMIHVKSLVHFRILFLIFLTIKLMPEIIVGRHTLVSITSIFRFDIDFQKPKVSYMIKMTMTLMK